VPVITTRVGAWPKSYPMVIPVCWSAGDPAALALAVTRYFREGSRERMAQAIEQARPRFDWQNLVMLIEEMAQ